MFEGKEKNTLSSLYTLLITNLLILHYQMNNKNEPRLRTIAIICWRVCGVEKKKEYYVVPWERADILWSDGVLTKKNIRLHRVHPIDEREGCGNRKSGVIYFIT